MALTYSNNLPLNTQAPPFKLPDAISGKIIDLHDIKSKTATVIMFICNHCPYVKHVQKELVRLANDYQNKGIVFIAISSNDVEKYPDDSPIEMKKVAQEWSYPFPYLYDETQEVAKAYQAACTPDFYIFDEVLSLVYHGQLDGSRPNNGIAVTGKDIRDALDCILSGKPVSSNQKSSMGCNIKWK